MIRAIYASFALAALLLPATAGAAKPKVQQKMVAVVDVQAAMQATAHWKTATDYVEKEKAARRAKFDGKQKELETRREKIEAKKAVADPSAVATEEAALYRDAQLLAQELMALQQEQAKIEQRIMEQMITRIEALTREVAVKEDYDYVFESGTPGAPNVLYSDPSVDVTQKVIDLYKQYFKDKPLELEQR